jgi:DNA ligase-associated metallophosphoesterase
MTTFGHSIKIYNNEFLIFPEKAAYWKKEKILLIADPHFGKTATFRSNGIAVPGGTTTENLNRINMLISKTNPSEIIFLGDFFHAKRGKAEKTITLLKEWRIKNSGITLKLVRGNHDKMSGELPSELDIIPFDKALQTDNFIFSHNPFEEKGKYIISGHVHPAVILRGKGREVLKLPCFYFSNGHAVLPSFGSFTGSYIIEPKPDDKIFVIADNEVILINKKTHK